MNANETIAQIKKMNTSAMKQMFREVVGEEPSNDRQMMIIRICNRMPAVIEWMAENEAKQPKGIEHFSMMIDKIFGRKNEGQFGMEEVVKIRNMKASGVSFKGIAKIFKISHIFARNICTGKVYKQFGGPIAEVKSRS